MPVSTENTQISIHALREEGDLSVLDTSVTATVFLSTPSARRATPGAGEPDPAGSISIHALREEGDQLAALNQIPEEISIHALREEGDRAYAPSGR